MLRIIILTKLLLFMSAAQANLQQSAFMKAFHDCVASYAGEELDDETLGVAESALMNGEFISGDIDSGFFSYMNCINPVSVQLSPTTLNSNLWCPHTDYTVNTSGLGVTLQLPYKRDGESVIISGMEFTCQGGGWNFMSAIDNNGVDADCAARTVSSDACQYTLPATEHANVASVFNTTQGYDGVYQAVCKDGEFEQVQASCDIATCQSGERVTWIGFENNEVRVCQGEVGANGSVVASVGDQREYFTNESVARSQSQVLFGTAQFGCRNDQWQRVNNSGFCRQKTPSEKTCASSGGNNAFCQ